MRTYAAHVMEYLATYPQAWLYMWRMQRDVLTTPLPPMRTIATSPLCVCCVYDGMSAMYTLYTWVLIGTMCLFYIG